MLNNNVRIQIEDILLRLSKGEQVTLKERTYISKKAQEDQSVASLLHTAKINQRNIGNSDKIDSLLRDLKIGSEDPDAIFNSNYNDLGEWFSGAPKWLTRS